MVIKMLLVFIKMAILIFGEFHYYCEDAKPKKSSIGLQSIVTDILGAF